MRKEYGDKLRQNYDYKGDKMMIDDCNQVNN